RHARGGRGLPARPLLAPRAGGVVTSAGGGTAARRRAALHAHLCRGGRLHRDSHPGGALAAPWRGRLPAGARPAGGRVVTRPFRLALPSKGRMYEPAVRLAREAGIDVATDGRALSTRCDRWGIEVVFARSDDIPVWAKDGAVEAAVAGRNQLVEADVASWEA